MVFVGLYIGIEYLENKRSGDKVAGVILFTPSSYLQNSCFTVIVPVLGHYLKQAS